MKSSLQATFLAATAALAVALGAAAAHAGDAENLAAAQQHAAYLDEMTGGKFTAPAPAAELAESDSTSDDYKGVLDALVGIIGEAVEE
jgi:uncharacterized membrane protein